MNKHAKAIKIYAKGGDACKVEVDNSEQATGELIRILKRYGGEEVKEGSYIFDDLNKYSELKAELIVREAGLTVL